MDDGCDLVATLHTQAPRTCCREMLGGTEETTTGVIRLRAMEQNSALAYPVIAVNDANTKHLFDNRYGTGQSTIDGIIRATNILLAGRKFVVCGYGWCGRGVALRAKGMGAIVTVVRGRSAARRWKRPWTATRSCPWPRPAKWGEIFITVTGDTSVLRKEHFEVDAGRRASCANSGHFDVEIDIPALRSLAVSERRVRPMVDEYTLTDGRRIYLLGEGRLVNLAAAEGHPAAVMDMSFANQALCAEYLVEHAQGAGAAGLHRAARDRRGGGPAQARRHGHHHRHA